MQSKMLYISIFFLGFCILIGGWMVSHALESNEVSPPSPSTDHVQVEMDQQEPYRYEIVPANESNLLFFDKKTGTYYRKFITPSEGPTEWTLEGNPFNDAVGTERSY